MRPRSVKIGARKYQISEETANSNPVLAENDGVRAYIDYDNSKIVLRSHISPSAMKEHLVHEILHGLLDNTGVDDESHEQFIRVLAPRVCALLADNKQLIEYLMAEVEE